MAKQKDRVRRDNDTLRRMAEGHLTYEFDMFHASATLIGDQTVQSCIPLRNAVIESIAVHTRVLLKFFFDTSPREDDVVAGDFYENPSTWNAWATQTWKDANVGILIDAIENRVNKEVVHLTYYRLGVKPDEKAWRETLRKANTILKLAYVQFIRTVPAANLAGKVLAEKKHILKAQPKRLPDK